MIESTESLVQRFNVTHAPIMNTNETYKQCTYTVPFSPDRYVISMQTMLHFHVRQTLENRGPFHWIRKKSTINPNGKKKILTCKTFYCTWNWSKSSYLFIFSTAVKTKGHLQSVQYLGHNSTRTTRERHSRWRHAIFSSFGKTVM